MDRETKTILLVVGLAALILIIARPSSNKKSKDELEEKYTVPKIADEQLVKDRENAVIALEAMRKAIDNGEKPQALNELKDIILKENGIKLLISKSTKKLKALNSDGTLIAEE